MYKILSLKDAENTEDVIDVIDEIYNHVTRSLFEKNGNLEDSEFTGYGIGQLDAWQGMHDRYEQMEDIIQKYLSNLKKKGSESGYSETKRKKDLISRRKMKFRKARI